MKKIALLSVFYCSLWSTVTAAPLTTTVFHLLDNADVTALLQTCKQKKGGCNSQDDRAVKNRAAVKESLTRDLGPGHVPPMSSEQAEKLLQGVQAIKVAFFALNKLTGIVPYDNGLLARDRVMKNQNDIDTLLGRIKGTLGPLENLDLSNTAGAVPLAGGLLGRKKRADSMSLDYYRGNRWPSNTINVFIDPKIWSTSEANIIRQALRSIMNAVGCITFVEKSQAPCIEFVRAPKSTDPGTCGWSSIGYQKGARNDVNLNFGSSICRPSIQGVCVHETLHALGFSHEHTRNDRDKNLRINWNNVDPSSASDLDKDDPNDYNPYGGQYDPLSIMHYDQYVLALNPYKPTLVPIKNPQAASKMGNGDAMTASDAKLLKRLYCTSSSCRDSSPQCGWRATNGECNSIRSSCPKSCGACDQASG